MVRRMDAPSNSSLLPAESRNTSNGLPCRLFEAGRIRDVSQHNRHSAGVVQHTDYPVSELQGSFFATWHIAASRLVTNPPTSIPTLLQLANAAP